MNESVLRHTQIFHLSNTQSKLNRSIFLQTFRQYLLNVLVVPMRQPLSSSAFLFSLIGWSNWINKSLKHPLYFLFRIFRIPHPNDQNRIFRIKLTSTIFDPEKIPVNRICFKAKILHVFIIINWPKYDTESESIFSGNNSSSLTLKPWCNLGSQWSFLWFMTPKIKYNFWEKAERIKINRLAEWPNLTMAW